MPRLKTPVGDRIFVAKDSFVCNYDGIDHIFVAGQTRVREGHPVMVGREQMFEPIIASPGYEYEQATAGPNETR